MQSERFWKDSKVLWCFDSSYGHYTSFLVPDCTAHLRRGIGRLRVELAWVEQPFRDSHHGEGGAQEGVPTVSRTDSGIWSFHSFQLQLPLPGMCSCTIVNRQAVHEIHYHPF